LILGGRCFFNVATLKFENQKVNENFIKTKKALKIQGITLKIERHQSKDQLRKQVESSSKRMIYVTNIPQDMTVAVFQRIFSQIGFVQKALLAPRGEKEKMGSFGAGKIFGYITYESYEDKLEALRVQTVTHNAKNGEILKLQIHDFRAKKMVKRRHENMIKQSRKNKKGPLNLMRFKVNDMLIKQERKQQLQKSISNLNRKVKNSQNDKNNNFSPKNYIPKKRRIINQNFQFYNNSSFSGQASGQVALHDPRMFDYNLGKVEKKNDWIRRISRCYDHTYFNIRFNWKKRKMY